MNGRDRGGDFKLADPVQIACVFNVNKRIGQQKPAEVCAVNELDVVVTDRAILGELVGILFSRDLRRVVFAKIIVSTPADKRSGRRPELKISLLVQARP